MEIELVVSELSRLAHQPTRILEIGSGDGFQINYLSDVGDVYPSDITNKKLGVKIPKHFIICSAEALPYPKNYFDVIFSSNVMEHIQDKSLAFMEMKRVSTKQALFVHILPTPVWKILSDFVYYPLTVLAIIKRVTNVRGDSQTIPEPKTTEKKRRWFERIIPPVHGTSKTLFHEYYDFLPNSWIKLFHREGLICVKKMPLITYSPPELPIVPPNRFIARFGFPSTFAYFLRKENN